MRKCYYFCSSKKGGFSMRRVFCLLLVFVMMSSLCVQAFADGDVLYCRMCGKKIPVDSKICSYCGEKVVLLTDETQDKAPVSDLKPAGNGSDAEALSAQPAANPDTAAVVAEMMAPPATDVKTALSQANAGPSPVTSVASAPVSSAAFAPAAPAYLNTAALTRQVYVTKSPTSESVPYGGSCSFIAHAANATSVTWYIYSGDGSIVTAASDAPYSVSGLYVNGGNSDTLYLSGIPSWWNGCQVQACFTGEGGPVYSDIARIWTYQPAQGKDTSGWSWWDWFCCYYRNDPYHWDYPWHWYDYWVRYPSCAPGWFRPGPHDFDLRPGQPKPKEDPSDPTPEGETDSIYLVGPNNGYNDSSTIDVVKIEKSDNEPWDRDYLERVWNYMYGDQSRSNSLSAQDNSNPPSGGQQEEHVSQEAQTPGNSQVTAQYVEDVDKHPASSDKGSSKLSSDDNDGVVIAEWIGW